MATAVRGRRALIPGMGATRDMPGTVYGEWAVIRAGDQYAVVHATGRWMDWRLRRSHAHAIARALAVAVPAFPGTAEDMRDLWQAINRSPAIKDWVDGVTRTRYVLRVALGA